MPRPPKSNIVNPVSTPLAPSERRVPSLGKFASPETGEVAGNVIYLGALTADPPLPNDGICRIWHRSDLSKVYANLNATTYQIVPPTGGGGGGMEQHANEWHNPDMALITDLTTHAGLPSVHHVRYSNAEALAAVVEILLMGNLADADTTTDPPVKNESLKWNGTKWVPAAYDYSFTFSIASFSDGEATTTLLIGTGVWRADEVMAYVATYNNGPPTSALAKMSINGGAYNQVGYMDAPNYLTGKNYDGNINYPSVDQYLRFRLDAGDGVDSDIEYETAIYFYNYRFWGVITAAQRAAITEAVIEGLSSELSNSTTITKTINSGAGQYLCLAFPARYASLLWGDDYEDDGNIGFNFNGISVAMELLTSALSVANSAGYAENYKVYAAYQPNLGNYSFQGGSAIAAINWLYWGELNKASGYTESDVEANYASQPGKVASNSISSRTMIVNCVSGVEYAYIAYPARLGALTSIMIGGFESLGDFNVDNTALSITNENGWSENYRVYVSKYPFTIDPTTMIVSI